MRTSKLSDAAPFDGGPEPWRSGEPPWTGSRQIPSMITAEEMQFLCYLAGQRRYSNTMIVDMGPLAGGSTQALAFGAGECEGVVHSYDLWRMCPGWEQYLPGWHFRIGDSILPAFLENLGLARHKWQELDRQIITSTFVRRSVDDGWRFAHRSFQEFFYARKFFRWEAETGGEGEFPVVHTPIWQFIAQMALEKWDREKALFWIRERVERENEPSLTMTTLRAAAGYWLLKKDPGNSRDHMFSGIMLDSVDLTELDLARCDLSRVDFHGSDLAGTNLASADLSGALLSGAQFLGADLRNTKFDHSEISYADFRGANFGAPNSSVWTGMITQLGNCKGLALALFDQDVSSFLANSLGLSQQRYLSESRSGLFR